MIIKSYEKSVNLKEILISNFNFLLNYLIVPILIENYQITSERPRVLVFSVMLPGCPSEWNQMCLCIKMEPSYYYWQFSHKS